MNRMHLLIENAKLVAERIAALEDNQFLLEDPNLDPLMHPHEGFSPDMSSYDIAHRVTTFDEMAEMGYQIDKVNIALKRLQITNTVINLQFEFQSRPIATGSKVQTVIGIDNKTYDKLSEAYQASLTRLKNVPIFKPQGISFFETFWAIENEIHARINKNQNEPGRRKIGDAQLYQDIFSARAAYGEMTMRDLQTDCDRIASWQSNALLIKKGLDEGLLTEDGVEITCDRFLEQSSTLLKSVQNSHTLHERYLRKLAESGQDVFLPREFLATRYVPLPLSP